MILHNCKVILPRNGTQGERCKKEKKDKARASAKGGERGGGRGELKVITRRFAKTQNIMIWKWEWKYARARNKTIHKRREASKEGSLRERTPREREDITFLFRRHARTNLRTAGELASPSRLLRAYIPFFEAADDDDEQRQPVSRLYTRAKQEEGGESDRAKERKREKCRVETRKDKRCWMASRCECIRKLAECAPSVHEKWKADKVGQWREREREHFFKFTVIMSAKAIKRRGARRSKGGGREALFFVLASRGRD